MNRDNVVKQDTAASEWDYPNGRNPEPHAPIYYGNQHVPRPTNTRAKTPHCNPMMNLMKSK
jgi:hypothetical protein